MRLLTILLLCLPLTVLADSHGGGEKKEHAGKPAEQKEHAGKPAEKKEHGGKPAEKKEHAGKPAESKGE
jgi:hypothetical protein